MRLIRKIEKNDLNLQSKLVCFMLDGESLVVKLLLIKLIVN